MSEMGPTAHACTLCGARAGQPCTGPTGRVAEHPHLPRLIAAGRGDPGDGLRIALEVAVPLRIAELARMTPAGRDRAIEQDAAAAVEQVAHRGDALMYGGKRGEAAAAFNALARGLAALAFQPGGVRFAGQHWCVNHAECEQADLEVAGRRTDRDPDADTEPDDAGEWYGDRRVEIVEIPGVS